MDETYIYERRTPVLNFLLVANNVNTDNYWFGAEHRNAEFGSIDGKSLMFLNIKSLNFEKMPFPFMIKNYGTEIIMALINSTNVTDIIEKTEENKATYDDYAQSLTSYINTVNNSIYNYTTKFDITSYGKIVYPQFTFEDTKLICNLQEKAGKGEDTYYLGFGKAMYDYIGKYFDVNFIWSTVGRHTYYYFVPINGVTTKPIVAHKDLTTLLFPKWNLIIEMCTGKDEEIKTDSPNYKRMELKVDTGKSYLEVNKYLLLADLTDTKDYINYKISFNIPSKFQPLLDIETGIEADIVELKDTFKQFDCYNVIVGNIYTETDYHEMSYKKLMGITAKYVYLQNGTSVEKLEVIKNLLQAHLGQNTADQTKSLWQTLRDMLDIMIKTDEKGPKYILEEIYRLLYHTQNIENFNPPDTKYAKIDF